MAKVIADDGQEQSYVGLADTEFKSRYANHTHSFRNPTKKNATELSKFIWALKDKNIDYTGYDGNGRFIAELQRKGINAKYHNVVTSPISETFAQIS